MRKNFETCQACSENFWTKSFEKTSHLKAMEKNYVIHQIYELYRGSVMNFFWYPSKQYNI